MIVKNKSKRALKLSENDNIAIALEDLQQGDIVSILTSSTREDICEVTVIDNVLFGHKIALENIAVDTGVIKYSCSIGLASSSIKVGEHVHVHNIMSQYLHGAV